MVRIFRLGASGIVANDLIKTCIFKSFFIVTDSPSAKGAFFPLYEQAFLSVQIYGLVNGVKMLIFLDY